MSAVTKEKLSADDYIFCKKILQFIRKDRIKTQVVNDRVIGEFLKNEFRRLADALEANGDELSIT